ncbi:MAG: PadR family transcriptional regulator [Christensenellales bacterium]|jgi:DNA-binding PadR family transcriptional regulator
MYFDLYILSFLMEAPHYGYEIKKKLIDHVGACASVSNNTLYPILRKYERMGAATRSVELSEGGQERIVYTLTDVGRKAFVNVLWNFPDNVVNDRDEFCIRLSFFPYMNRESRVRLLDLREKFLQNSRSKVERSLALPDAPEHKIKLRQFHMGIICGEEELIRYFRARVDEPCILNSDGYLVAESGK